MDNYNFDLSRILQDNVCNLDEFIRHEVATNPSGEVKKYVVQQCITKLQRSFEDYRSIKRPGVTIEYYLDSNSQGIITNKFNNYDISFVNKLNTSLSYYRSLRLLLLRQFVDSYSIPTNVIRVVGGDVAENVRHFSDKVHTCLMESNLNSNLYETYMDVSKLLQDKMLSAATVTKGKLLELDYSANRVQSSFFCYGCELGCDVQSKNVFSFMDFLKYDIRDFINNIYTSGAKFAKLYMPFVDDIFFSKSGNIAGVIDYRIQDGKIKFFLHGERIVFEYDFNNYSKWLTLSILKFENFIVKLLPSRDFSGFIEITVNFYNRKTKLEVDTAFWNKCFEKKYKVNYRVYTSYKKNVKFFDIFNPFVDYGPVYETKSFIVDADLVEKGKEYAYRVSAEKFKPTELFSYLQSHNRRWFIGGKDVLTKTCVTIADELFILAHAIYLDVYNKKYDMSKSLQLNVETINLQRNLAKKGFFSKLFFSTLASVSHAHVYQGCSLFNVYYNVMNKLHSYVYKIKIGNDMMDDIIISDMEMKEFNRVDVFKHNAIATDMDVLTLQDEYHDMTLDVSGIYGTEKIENVCRGKGDPNALVDMRKVLLDKYTTNGKFELFGRTVLYFYNKKLIMTVKGSHEIIFVIKNNNDAAVEIFDSTVTGLLTRDMRLDDFLLYYTFTLKKVKGDGYCLYRSLHELGYEFDMTSLPADPLMSSLIGFAKVFGVGIFVYHLRFKRKYLFVNGDTRLYFELNGQHLDPLLSNVLPAGGVVRLPSSEIRNEVVNERVNENVRNVVASVRENRVNRNLNEDAIIVVNDNVNENEVVHENDDNQNLNGRILHPVHENDADENAIVAQRENEQNDIREHVFANVIEVMPERNHMRENEGVDNAIVVERENDQNDRDVHVFANVIVREDDVNVYNLMNEIVEDIFHDALDVVEAPVNVALDIMNGIVDNVINEVEINGIVDNVVNELDVPEVVVDDIADVNALMNVDSGNDTDSNSTDSYIEITDEDLVAVLSSVSDNYDIEDMTVAVSTRWNLLPGDMVDATMNVFECVSVNKYVLQQFVNLNAVTVFSVGGVIVESFDNAEMYVIRARTFVSESIITIPSMIIDLRENFGVTETAYIGDIFRERLLDDSIELNVSTTKHCVIEMSEFNYDFACLSSMERYESLTVICSTNIFFNKYEELKRLTFAKIYVNYLFEDSCDMVCIFCEIPYNCVKLYYVSLFQNNAIRKEKKISPHTNILNDHEDLSNVLRDLTRVSMNVTDATSACDYDMLVCEDNLSELVRMMCGYMDKMLVINIKKNKFYIGVRRCELRERCMTENVMIDKLRCVIVSFTDANVTYKDVVDSYYVVEFGMRVSIHPQSIKLGLVLRTYEDVIGTNVWSIKESDVKYIELSRKSDVNEVLIPRAYLKFFTNERLQIIKNHIKYSGAVVVYSDILSDVDIVKLFSEATRINIKKNFYVRMSMLSMFRPTYVSNDCLYNCEYVWNCINEIRETWFWTIKTIVNSVSDVHATVLENHRKGIACISTIPSYGLIDVKNNKWIIKPERQLHDVYTHAYNGRDLIVMDDRVSFSEHGINGYTGDESYLSISNDMSVVNAQFLYQSTQTIDTIKFNSKILICSGAPGSGKSSFIINNAKHGDIILTTTKSGAMDISSRLISNPDKDSIIVKTGDSYLIHSRERAANLFIDEGFMKHPGEIMMYIGYSSASNVYILGDCAQIPFINRFRQIAHSCEIKFLNYNEIYRNVSHRCPLDVVTTINTLGLYPFVVETSNHLTNTMKVVRIPSITALGKHHDVYLTFLQAEKMDLKKKNLNVFTVHEYQGQQSDDVALVRLTAKNHEVFKSVNHVLVALSRHTTKLTYYSVDTNDYTSNLIQNSSSNLKFKFHQRVGRDTEFLVDPVMSVEKYEIISAHKISKHIIDSYFQYDTPGMKVKYLNAITKTIDDDFINHSTTLDINYLQDVVDHIYPGRSVYNRQYDTYIYDTTDVIVNVDNMTINASMLPAKYKDYAIPVLRTGIQPPVEMTVSNILYSYGDRNGCVPDYMGLVDNHDLVGNLLTAFKKAYVEDCVTFDKFINEPVGYDSNAIDKWLTTKDKNVINSMKAERDFCDSKLNVYEYLLKRNAKPKLDENGTHGFTSPQTISAHQKIMNSVFCPIIKVLKDRLVSVLRKDVIINNDMSVQGFEDVLSAYMDPLTISEYDYMLEVDFSKYDKSQDLTCYKIEEALLIALGFPVELMGIWRYATFICKLINIKTKVIGKIIYQRKSGTAVTYLGNTLVAMGTLCMLISRLSKCKCLFSGDDSLIFSRFVLDVMHLSYDLATIYNLDSKLLKYKCIYFCSKFLIPVADNKWIVVPDPIKILIKLGRTDLVDDEHVEQYRVSLVDNVKNFCYMDMHVLMEDCLYDRYGMSMSGEMLCMTIYNLVNDCDAFKNMYDTSACVYHSSKPSLEI